MGYDIKEHRHSYLKRMSALSVLPFFSLSLMFYYILCIVYKYMVLFVGHCTDVYLIELIFVT